MQETTDFVFLTKSKVKEESGIKSDSTLYHLIRTSSFPKPYKLSERLVGWRSNEIDEWKLSRKQAEIVEA